MNNPTARMTSPPREPQTDAAALEWSTLAGGGCCAPSNISPDEPYKEWLIRFEAGIYSVLPPPISFPNLESARVWCEGRERELLAKHDFQSAVKDLMKALAVANKLVVDMVDH